LEADLADAFAGRGYNIALDPSEKTNVADANPDEVLKLQQRANQLAATMVKPMLLETEFKAMRERLALPPALPSEEAAEPLRKPENWAILRESARPYLVFGDTVPNFAGGHS
jgi:hypothetical protein